VKAFMEPAFQTRGFGFEKTGFGNTAREKPKAFGFGFYKLTVVLFLVVHVH
jgi:hypothetical protein